jgi:hypothetical protein
MTSVDIIVLTWNERELTLSCLESLRHIEGSKTDVRTVVVDNGSTDNTPQAVRDRFSHVVVLETGENLGYAGGNNVGICYALKRGADAVCILNNDVEVAPDFLVPLIEAVGDERGGVATPLIAEMKDKQRTWALGAKVDWQRGTVRRLHAGEPVAALVDFAPFDVDVAPGAAMLVRREVFERVGLLDEDFYLYYEEGDWSLRVRASGYWIKAVPASLVYHHVSAALGTRSPIIDYYMLRNQLRFVYRHWPGLNRWRVLGSVMARNLLTIVVYTVKPRGGVRRPHRDARLLALRDALMGRWGRMGTDVSVVCDGVGGH